MLNFEHEYEYANQNFKTKSFFFQKLLACFNIQKLPFHCFRGKAITNELKNYSPKSKTDKINIRGGAKKKLNKTRLFSHSI